MPARILVIAATTAPGAPCARLAAEAARLLSLSDAQTTLISLADYPLPLHDPDLAASGVPPLAQALAHRIARQDGLFLSVCEIDGSLPALTKNMLEWTGRLQTVAGRVRRPYEALPVAIGAAGASGRSNAAALAAAELCFTALGAERLEPSLDAPDFPAEFDETGRLSRGPTLRSLEHLVEQLLEHTHAIGRLA